MKILPYIEQQPTIMLILSAVAMIIALVYLIKYFNDYRTKEDFSKYSSILQSLLIIASLTLFLNYSLDLRSFYLTNKTLHKEQILKKELISDHSIYCYYIKENKTLHINLYTDKYEEIHDKDLEFTKINGHIYLQNHNKTFDILNCFPKSMKPNNDEPANIPKNH